MFTATFSDARRIQPYDHSHGPVRLTYELTCITQSDYKLILQKHYINTL
jgi:hypothetical protein